MAIGMGLAKAKAARSQQAAAIGRSIAAAEKRGKKAAKKAAKKAVKKKAPKKAAKKKAAKKKASKRRRKARIPAETIAAKPTRRRKRRGKKKASSKPFSTKMQVGRLKGRVTCPPGTTLVTTGVAHKTRKGVKYVQAWGRCVAIKG